MTELTIIGSPIWLFSSVCFVFAAIFGDVLLIRLFLVFGYTSLLIWGAVGAPASWGDFMEEGYSNIAIVLACVIPALLHTLALCRLLYAERPIEFRNEEEEEIYRCFYRRSGMKKLEMRSTLDKATRITLRAGEVLSSYKGSQNKIRGGRPLSSESEETLALDDEKSRLNDLDGYTNGYQDIEMDVFTRNGKSSPRSESPREDKSFETQDVALKRPQLFSPSSKRGCESGSEHEAGLGDLYFILEGRIRCTEVHGGVYKTCYRRFSGDFFDVKSVNIFGIGVNFGFDALLAQAETNVVLYKWTAKDLFELDSRSPALSGYWKNLIIYNNCNIMTREMMEKSHQSGSVLGDKIEVNSSGSEGGGRSRQSSWNEEKHVEESLRGIHSSPLPDMTVLSIPNIDRVSACSKDESARIEGRENLVCDQTVDTCTSSLRLGSEQLSSVSCKNSGETSADQVLSALEEGETEGQNICTKANREVEEEDVASKVGIRVSGSPPNRQGQSYIEVVKPLGSDGKESFPIHPLLFPVFFSPDGKSKDFLPLEKEEMPQKASFGKFCRFLHRSLAISEPEGVRHRSLPISGIIARDNILSGYTLNYYTPLQRASQRGKELFFNSGRDAGAFSKSWRRKRSKNGSEKDGRVEGCAADGSWRSFAVFRKILRPLNDMSDRTLNLDEVSRRHSEPAAEYIGLRTPTQAENRLDP